MAGLQDKVMREDVIDYVLQKFEEDMIKATKSIGRELSQMQKRKATLEEELGNLVGALATGQRSPSIMKAIADRENEIASITERAVSNTTDCIRAQMGELQASARAKLRDLRLLLNGDVEVARAGLLKHVERITLTPEGKTIVARGTTNY